MALEYSIVLYNEEGVAINDAGGIVKVVTAGGFNEVALTDTSGASIANPISLTNGEATWRTPAANTTVDIYVQGPDGRCTVVRGLAAGHDTTVRVDTSASNGVMLIPFDVTDSDITAASEFTTGFTADTAMMYLGIGAGVYVGTTDATETIDVGTDSGDSGDANGFLAAVAVSGTNGTFAKATLASGGQTLGDLLRADESGAGVLVPEGHVGDGKAITLTLSAGTDTAAGMVVLPYAVVGI